MQVKGSVKLNNTSLEAGRDLLKANESLFVLRPNYVQFAKFSNGE